jgi:O-antigen/teichoic acid export membrane protein
MQRNFLSNLFILLFLNVLIKPFYIFGIDTHVQNIVGEEAYGSYFALLNFSLLFNILLDFGLVNYTISHVAKDPNWISKNIKQIFTIRILLALLYGIVSFIIAIIFKLDADKFWILGLLLLNQVFVAIVFIVRANFAGLQRFKIDAFFSVFDRLILIFICIYLFYFYEKSLFKIEWFIYAQTIAYGFSAIFALIWGSKVFGLVGWRLRKEEVKSLIIKCLPFSLLIFTMIAYQRLDAILLSGLHENGNFQAGIYAQSFRLQDGVNMFAQLFASLLLSMYANLLNDKKEIQKLLTYAFQLLMSAIVVGVIVAYFVRDQLMSDLYSHSDPSGKYVYIWLVLALIPMCFVHLYSSLLTAKGRLKEAIYAALASLIVCIVGNLILAPTFGAQGSAIVNFLTVSTMGIFSIYYVWKLEGISVKSRVWFKILGLATGCFLTGLVTKEFIQSYWVAIAISTVGTTLFFILRLISIEDLKALFKLKKANRIIE